MFGGLVLDLEGKGAGCYWGGGGGEGAEVHEDGGAAVVGDHDVSCFREMRGQLWLGALWKV